LDVPDSNTGVRLILKAFSDAEWVLLKGHREFMGRIDSVKTIEEADTMIREGAGIVEKAAMNEGKGGNGPEAPGSDLR
jgi:hypothetical protein